MDIAEIASFFINGFFMIFLMSGALIVRFRDRKNPLHRSFYNFYLYFSIGFLINIIYRLQDSIFWKEFLNRLTMAFISFGLIFYLLFNLILLNEKKFNIERRWIIVIFWAILCSVLLYLDWDNGVSWIITPDFPSGIPYWSTVYTIYVLTLNQSLFIILYIVANITQKKVKREKYKASHLRKNMAIIFINWFVLGNILNNWVIIREAQPWFAQFLVFSSIIASPGFILFWISATRKVPKESSS